MNYSNITYLKKELDKIKTLFKKEEFDLVIKKSEALLKKNPNQVIIYNYIGLSYIQLNDIENALKSGRNVQLRDLGNFFVKKIKEKYSARNPKTAELIYVPEKNKVRFKASKKLKKLINE